MHPVDHIARVNRIFALSPSYSPKPSNPTTVKNPFFRSAQGFSLVELLVVIAVIGIIAAIAIPNIANVSQAAKTAKDQRNAQTVANVASEAIAAGFTNWRYTYMDDKTDWLINTLNDGVDVTNGANVMHFQVGPFQFEDYQGMEKYLTFDGTSVHYSSVATTNSGTH